MWRAPSSHFFLRSFLNRRILTRLSSASGPNCSACCCLASSRSFRSKPLSSLRFIFSKYWLLLLGCFLLMWPPRLWALLNASQQMWHWSVGKSIWSEHSRSSISLTFAVLCAELLTFGVCCTAVEASVRAWCCRSSLIRRSALKILMFASSYSSSASSGMASSSWLMWQPASLSVSVSSFWCLECFLSIAFCSRFLLPWAWTSKLCVRAWKPGGPCWYMLSLAFISSMPARSAWSCVLFYLFAASTSIEDPLSHALSLFWNSIGRFYLLQSDWRLNWFLKLRSKRLSMG